MRQSLITASMLLCVASIQLTGCDDPKRDNDPGEEVQEAAKATGIAAEQAAREAKRELGPTVKRANESAERLSEKIENAAYRAGQDIKRSANQADKKLNQARDEAEARSKSADQASDRAKEKATTPPSEETKP